MGTIKHESFVNLFNKNNNVYKELLTGADTLSKFTYRMTKIARNFDNYYYKSEEKLKGDLFEIFAECFFKIFAADNRIGIYDYSPTPSIEDYGVDGTGKGMDNNPLTVQIKYRTDINTELTQDDIKQFAFQSIITYDVDKNTRSNMVIFTNASGLHWITESQVFSGRLRVIGFKEISLLVDRNNVFWKMFNDLVLNTIEQKYGEFV